MNAPSRPVLSIINGHATTTSTQIAEHFGKEHKSVLRAIQNLGCSTEFTERNFAPSEITDSTGRTLPAFIITRDGFSFLAMGFTGKEAAQWKEAYIEAFNAMEAALQPPAADTLEARKEGLTGAEYTARESLSLARLMLIENGTAAGIKPARVAIITAVISLIEGAGAILQQERARLCHAMAAIDNSAIGEPDLYFGRAAQPSPEARAAWNATAQLRAVKGGVQ